jgi:hypothetical protein
MNIEQYNEIIHDGNIYYSVPCKNGCGIEWLTIDELELNNGFCSDCENHEKEL